MQQTKLGPQHFVSRSCIGMTCHICGRLATHKVGEEIPSDDPNPVRHNLTAYVCCSHFTMLLGPATPCTGIWQQVAEDVVKAIIKKHEDDTNAETR